jgi:hypothetical protein
MRVRQASQPDQLVHHADDFEIVGMIFQIVDDALDICRRSPPFYPPQHRKGTRRRPRYDYTDLAAWATRSNVLAALRPTTRVQTGQIRHVGPHASGAVDEFMDDVGVASRAQLDASSETVETESKRKTLLQLVTSQVNKCRPRARGAGPSQC